MPVVRQANLRVVQFPQNDNYVPGIRVAGKWLAVHGFPYGTEVQLTASEGRIIIERKGVGDEAGRSTSQSKGLCYRRQEVTI